MGQEHNKAHLLDVNRLAAVVWPGDDVHSPVNLPAVGVVGHKGLHRELLEHVPAICYMQDVGFVRQDRSLVVVLAGNPAQR